MESIPIELPRERRYFQTGAWGLIVIVWILQTSLRWDDGGWARAGSIAVLLLAIAMFVAVWRIRSLRADADGVHRSLLHGRRRIPWREVEEIRPTPGRADRLTFRGASGRTLAEAEMPLQKDLDQLHTWHANATGDLEPQAGRSTSGS